MRQNVSCLRMHSCMETSPLRLFSKQDKIEIVLYVSVCVWGERGGLIPHPCQLSLHQWSMFIYVTK
jgi:hypothetical protein